MHFQVVFQPTNHESGRLSNWMHLRSPACHFVMYEFHKPMMSWEEGWEERGQAGMIRTISDTFWELGDTNRSKSNEVISKKRIFCNQPERLLSPHATDCHFNQSSLLGFLYLAYHRKIIEGSHYLRIMIN